MATKKATTTIPAASLAQYDALAATLPGVEIKGVTMPYTSANGHMFSFLDKEGVLALRLPADSREIFIKRYKTALCEAHGTVLKEYVAVPGKLLKDTRSLQPWFAQSYDYVLSLKPKPTKAKK